MNTPYRKEIFKILISSSNVSDAVENLLLLDLQQKMVTKLISSQEIIAVIGHLFLKEKKVNEFYVQVLNKLCQTGSQNGQKKGKNKNNQSRSFLISLKTNLWDRLNEVISDESENVSDGAWPHERLFLLTSSLTLKSNLISLLVFKNFDFINLSKNGKVFLKKFFTTAALDATGFSKLVNSTRQESANSKNLLSSIAVFIQFYLLGGEANPTDKSLKKFKNLIDILTE